MKKIATILAALAALSLTLGAQYEFIVSTGLYEQLEEYVRKFEAEGEQERVKEYSQVYEQLCRLLEQIAELLAGEELELKEYIEIFLAGIDEIKLGVLPQDVDGVVLGDVERTRLKPVRVLFFAGLNDGIIPAALKGAALRFPPPPDSRCSSSASIFIICFAGLRNASFSPLRIPMKKERQCGNPIWWGIWKNSF